MRKQNPDDVAFAMDRFGVYVAQGTRTSAQWQHLRRIDSLTSSNGASALALTCTATPLLTEAAGAPLGTTLAQVRPLYPSDAFSAEQGGRIAVAGARAGDRLFLGFFDQAPTTP